MSDDQLSEIDFGLTLYSHEFLYMCRYPYPIRLYPHRPIPHPNTRIEPRRQAGIRDGRYRNVRHHLRLLRCPRDQG